MAGLRQAASIYGDNDERRFRNRMVIDGTIALGTAALAVTISPPMILVTLIYAWSCGGYTRMWLVERAARRA